MTTLFLEWNDDLKVTPSGSLQLAIGWDEVRQRIIRRVITSAAQEIPDGTLTLPDYIFHPDYGIGLGKLVGQNFNDELLRRLEGKITQGILLDSAVETSQPPSITFYRTTPDTLLINASVNVIGSGPGVIQFVISRGG